MTDATLNDVFEDDKAEVTETKEVAEQDEPEAKEAEAEEVEVEDAEPTAAKDKDEPQEWTKKAVLDERRKRQALEAQVEELKKGKPKEEEGEPDLSTIMHRERINLSRELMIETRTDYEDMETVFLDMAKENPSLISEMNRSPNPAKFAYNKAKEHSEYLEFKASKESPEYKEFLEFKAGKSKKEAPEDKRKASAVKVPDLTKAAAKGRNSEEPESPGDLKSIMADAPF